MATDTRPVHLHRARAVDYGRALAWQRATAAGVLAVRAAGAAVPGGEALAVIEHTPVYTLGRRGNREHVLADPATLLARGAAVVPTDRGGDVTFHGPGQLVAYPILDLRARRLGAAAYVRALEQCVIETLATFGIRGARVDGRPGVWTRSALPPGPPPGNGRGDEDADDPRAGRALSASPLPLPGGGPGGRVPGPGGGPGSAAKLAAVGVRIERGVSRHGLALNIDTDLAWFDAIVPCGIADAGVTSMARELGEAPAFDEVVHAFARAFARAFNVTFVEAAGLLPAGREAVPA